LDLSQNNSSIKDLVPRIATNKEKKSSLLIAGRMASSRSRGKELRRQMNTFSAGRSGQGKISENSWRFVDKGSDLDAFILFRNLGYRRFFSNNPA
jgi:hypothetical protein